MNLYLLQWFPLNLIPLKKFTEIIGVGTKLLKRVMVALTVCLPVVGISTFVMD